MKASAAKHNTGLSAGGAARLWALVLLLLAVFFGSFFLGRYGISPLQLLAMLAEGLQRAPGQKTVTLILAGIMVSSLFSAGTSYIKLVADPGSKLPEITYWLMGSLSGTRGYEIAFALLPMALGLLPLLCLRWRLNLLTLGEEEARALGVNTALLRLIVVVCSTLITAASVAVSGLIGWVGLVIPHLCRRYIGNDYRRLLPATMLFGAAFLLVVDNISRNLLAVEIPIGILTAFIGAPFFIYLMSQKGGGA